MLKDIQSLSTAAYRKESGLFLAEGPKVVQELMQTAPGSIEAVYATERWQPGMQHPALQRISEAELGRISSQKTPAGVVAVVRQFPSSAPEVSGITLYLDAVQDPGNLGTIIRIADWFGVKSIVCSRGCADAYNPKTVQSTMGSISRVNAYDDHEETWLRNQTSPVYAAALSGKPVHSFGKLAGAVLVIGNESRGIRDEFLSLATDRITVEKQGEAESLNAAVATGILLSHLTPGPSPP